MFLQPSSNLILQRHHFGADDPEDDSGLIHDRINGPTSRNDSISEAWSSPLLQTSVQSGSHRFGTYGLFIVAKKCRDADALKSVTRINQLKELGKYICGICRGINETLSGGFVEGHGIKVNQILRELSRECNHFCDEFCDRLGVPKLPGWVNRFAHAGDAAVEIAGTTALKFRQEKTEIVSSASKVAYRFLTGVASNNSAVGPESSSPGNSNRGGGGGGGSPRIHASWFKNLIAAGALVVRIWTNNNKMMIGQQGDRFIIWKHLRLSYCEDFM